MTTEKLVLDAADYSIIAFTLLISSLIGVYYQFANKKTNEEFLLAGKDMSILPVAFSLMATFMSSTTLMGIPAEMYLYGTNMTFINLGFIIGPLIASYLFLPIYFNNDFSTAYEYLERRFGKKIRKLISGMFLVGTAMITSATLFAPALALSAVTNLSMWMSIVSIGAVCTFYSSLGGMKAVLWTDVFQAILMYTCLLVIIVIGCSALGGLFQVFQVSNEGGRLFFPSVSVDLGKHYTIFNVLATGIIISLSSYGGSQLQVQRLVSIRNLKRSRIAAFLSIPMIVSFQLLCCLCGLIFYVYFRDCNPMAAPDKPIESPDQLMPYFITRTMNNLPGLPGICIVGIFSSSLSTVSSAINSMTAVTLQDFIVPLFPKSGNNVLKTKFISLFYGSLCIALSFIVSALGNLVKMSILIAGLYSGPNLAIYILAACTTTANEEGVIVGLIASVCLSTYLTFEPITISNYALPLSDECPHLANSTYFLNNTISSYQPTSPTSILNETMVMTVNISESEPFHIAYMWISSVGLITCLVVGFLGSMVIDLIRGMIRNRANVRSFVEFTTQQTNSSQSAQALHFSIVSQMVACP